MDVKDRIKFLMDSVKMSQQDFAKVLGITPGSLSGILNERTRPTNNHTLAIHKAFPNININWLLFGEGEMYTVSSAEEVAEGNEIGKTGVPVTDSHSVSVHPTAMEFNFDAEETVTLKNEARPGNLPVEPKVIKRCVKEIRIFYDDGTYESFVSSEK